MPNIVTKDPIVDTCRGPKPNPEHTVKTDGLYERRVLKMCSKITKTLKNVVAESLRKRL